MQVIKIEIRKLPHAPGELPEYQSGGAAGMDLRLAGADVTLKPSERVLLPTGFCIAVPDGFEAQVRMRSGFALRTGVLLPNAPGTIDSDYRGELKVLVMNGSTESVTIRSGKRFAQLIISPVARCVWDCVDELSESSRGPNGFGSTGNR